jgi:hypothetical protein
MFMPRKYIDRQNNAKKSSAPISTQAQIQKKTLTSDMGSGIAVWFDKSTFWHGAKYQF